MLIRGGGEDVKNEKVVIDLDSIPEYVRQYLLASFVEAAREYMKQPEMQEKFERWMEEKKAAEKREK